MIGLDPLYFILVGPTFLLAMWASWKVKHTFNKFSRVPASSGMTGAEAAHMMLRAAGLERTVGIESVGGFLSDHYDPGHRVLRLSPEVYNGHSLASVGVACHEAGHAIQHAKGYKPLVIRNAIVPTAGIGSNLGMILVVIGMVLNMTGLAIVGLVLFSAVVVFQLVNLPVEFNASNRAKEMLGSLGIVRGPAEAAGVKSVLDAAAMTYVAGTLTAVMTLLYYALIIFGGRRE